MQTQTQLPATVVKTTADRDMVILHYLPCYELFDVEQLVFSRLRTENAHKGVWSANFRVQIRLIRTVNIALLRLHTRNAARFKILMCAQKAKFTGTRSTLFTCKTRAAAFTFLSTSSQPCALKSQVAPEKTQRNSYHSKFGMTYELINNS